MRTLEASTSLTTNLKTAADLVRSRWKGCANDSSSEMKRSFMPAYIDEILLSLHPKIKRTQHEITVTGTDSIPTLTVTRCVFADFDQSNWRIPRSGASSSNTNRSAISILISANATMNWILRYSDS
ncbi:MAG: hypothetical protein U5M23_08565 [Marinagarivorans sp.]|nr:hypothetical protein [Marinagarivorans sp.]